MEKVTERTEEPAEDEESKGVPKTEIEAEYREYGTHSTCTQENKTVYSDLMDILREIEEKIMKERPGVNNQCVHI